MKKNIAIAGNIGPKIRSDCQVQLEIKKTGGIQIELHSKVKALYGQSIAALIKEILAHFDITHACVEIHDAGALPFVIAARMEAAIKLIVDTEKEYLPEISKTNTQGTEKDKFRFTRLYLPGNTPKMMLNASLHSPEGIILDLEDSVAPAKKDEARLLVRNALRILDFYGAERMVRVNQGELGISDLDFVVPHHVNLILVPKCESAEYLKTLDARVEEIRQEKQISHPVYLMPIIESALGVENAFEMACVSPNVVSLAIGLEDFTADLGVQRTNEGTESLYARYRVVNACKAAGIQPIDSVFSDVSDMDALRQNVKASRAMGFEGMGCIHPRQIPVIQECFKPDGAEIDKAMKIADAFYKADEQGLGVVALGSKMIDPPVVKRALRTLLLAISFNMISKDWRKQYVS